MYGWTSYLTSFARTWLPVFLALLLFGCFWRAFAESALLQRRVAGSPVGTQPYAPARSATCRALYYVALPSFSRCGCWADSQRQPSACADQRAKPRRRNRPAKTKPLVPCGTRGFEQKKSGSDLLSHAVSRGVPSALEGLTSVFGMGTGVTPPT